MGTIIFIIIFAAILGLIIYVTNSAPSHEQTQRELAAKISGDKADVDVNDLLDEVESIRRHAEVLIQADSVGDTATHEAIMNGTYDGPYPEKRADGAYLSLYDNLRILKIAGINYCTGMNRYKGRVMCALVPEPNNEYDPNAIKIVAIDRHHLGYIPSEQTDFVRSLTGGDFPYKCEAHIYEAEDEDDGHTFYYGSVYIKRKDKGE